MTPAEIESKLKQIERMHVLNTDLRRRVLAHRRENEKLRAENSALRASRDELSAELKDARAEQVVSPAQSSMPGLRALINTA